MNDKIKKLKNDFGKAEHELFHEVKKLKNYGKACDCKSPEWSTIVTTYDSQSNKNVFIRETCTLCGGFPKSRLKESDMFVCNTCFRRCGDEVKHTKEK